MTTFEYGGLEPRFCAFKTSKIVILPVPFDKTSTWQKGADKGPEAIFEASCNMELYDEETDFEAYRKGIFTDEPVREDKSPEDMAAAVHKCVSGLLDKKKFVVTVGGEHSVSIGAVTAHAAHFKNLSVLQLDAHADLRSSYHNSRYNHACVMARIKEVCPIVQVGIRSMEVSEKKNMDRQRMFFAKDIHSDDAWMNRAISKLTENVYITIDLDAFDPSLLPSTGTPEPGGLGWWQALKFLRMVIEKKNLVGFDVVELCPRKDARASDFLAAKLIYKLLSYSFR